MKPTEVSVGNIMVGTAVGDRFYLGELTKISNSGAASIRFGKTSSGSGKLENFIEVPIYKNLDILQENGFIRLQEYPCRIMQFKNDKLTIHYVCHYEEGKRQLGKDPDELGIEPDEVYVSIDGTNKYGTISVGKAPVRYYHELQNLLASLNTGVTLTLSHKK